MANIQNWLWPAVDDFEEFKKAAHLGAGCAFLVAVVTGIVTVLTLRGMKLFSGIVDASSLLDAGLFLVIGIFIYRYSRIAAVAGLLLYVGEQVMMIKTTGARFSLIPIFFTLHFISGVRGTFAYHQFKKLETEETSPAAPPQVFQPQPESSKKKSVFLVIAAVLLFLAAAIAGGFYFLTHARGNVSMPQLETVFSKNEPAAAALERSASEPVSSGQTTFRMKDGKSVTGRILMEDEVYYTVETSGGRQEIVIKEDLA